MAVYAYMVTKNEAGRYLKPCLNHLSTMVSGIAVYDDQSSDDTATICERIGAKVMVRPDGVPSFVEHEGKFRQAAWDYATEVLDLTTDDWVLAIDADEFLMHPDGDEDYWLRLLVRQSRSATSVVLSVFEVFGFDTDGTPLIRTDGLWGKIAGTRLFRYQPAGVFADKSMGCGSEPTYVRRKSQRFANGLYILHYGYASPQDQQAKYQRYSSLGNHGHNNDHVESIVKPGEYERFTLAYPRI